MKTILMAMIPLCLAASNAMAADDLLSELASGATDSIRSASIEIETGALDGLDIAGLT